MSCSTTTTARVFAISRRQAGGFHGFGIGHAGDGFVDEEQFRLLRQKHADLQPLLLAVGEIGGQLIALRAVMRIVSRISSMRSRSSPVRLVEQGRKHAAFAVQRQFQIVPHGMAFEHGRLLELAADAELGDIGLVAFG